MPSRLLKARPGGSGQLKINVPKYLELSSRCPVTVFTDLDNWSCPVALLQDWFGARAIPEGMAFRIAVREVESWLMADREGISEFLGVASNRIPNDVDSVVAPKQILISIARKAPKEIRAEIVPSARSAAVQGIGYNDVLSKFVRERWSSSNAASGSASLRRALVRLDRVRDFWRQRGVQ